MPLHYRHDAVPFAADPDRMLLRRWVLTTPLGTVRLHHLCAPDVEMFHDHPWAFWSLVLRGWYAEEFPDGSCVRRSVLSWAWRSERVLHRVSAVSDGGCWTFVLTGPRRKSWGFLRGGTWLPWRAVVHPSVASDADARHGKNS